MEVGSNLWHKVDAISEKDGLCVSKKEKQKVVEFEVSRIIGGMRRQANKGNFILIFLVLFAFSWLIF